MLWDTHMHSGFSGDSTAEPESMALAAQSRRLDGICFTDHLDLDYPKEKDLFLLDLPAYTAHIHTLQSKFDGSFPILCGLELGLQPHLAKKHGELLSQYAFDFVIGSSHVVHGADPYYPEYYGGRSASEGYREYFESILENIQAFDGFDVYGHLDYVVRYGPAKSERYDWKKYQEIIEEILSLLIKKGKGIELNTAGFKYGLSHPNPTEEIIARYRELGGEIITIGADAHKPDDIAFDFRKVPALLSAAGFTSYTVFQNRKPRFIKLDF